LLKKNLLVNEKVHLQEKEQDKQNSRFKSKLLQEREQDLLLQK
jgi:hypothetical protein